MADTQSRTPSAAIDNAAVVIPFVDPNAPLQGEARDAALAIYREHVPAIALHAISNAFRLASRVPGTRKLGCEDVLPIFVKAFRDELATVWTLMEDRQ